MPGTSENNYPLGSDAYIASRLRFAFEKHQQDWKCTMVFSDFNESTRTFFADECNLDGDELPVLAFLESRNRWHLLTSRGIFFCEDSGVISIDYRDIRSIAWCDGPNGRAPCPGVGSHKTLELDDDDRYCKICVLTNPWLTVMTKNKKRYYIPVEPKAAFGLWDLFRLAERIERIHPRQ